MRMKFMSVIMILVISYSGPAWSGCWAVYSDDFRSTYYSASGINLPQRAGNFATMQECQAALSAMLSDPTYSSDYRLSQTRCECDGATSYAPSSSGQSIEQQLVTTVVSAFLNAMLRGLQAEPGAAGDAERQALQKQWEKEEQDRRLAEKKRQDAAFANAQSGALALLGTRPKPSGGESVDTGGDLKPGGTSFFGLGGGPGPGGDLEPMNDPMVVDLRHLRRASYFAQAVETSSTEDVGLLLDEALKVANGGQSSLGSIPAGAALPEINDRGLLAFQQVNADYAKAHDLFAKRAEDLKVAQRRREQAHEVAAARRAEVERQMAGKSDQASLKKKRELLAAIEAALQAEDAAWRKAKAEYDAAERQTDKAREESVRVLRALALGKDPAGFHPPIASLPALKEENWQAMQKRMLEERAQLEARSRKLQKELGSVVPPLKGRERVHEGVILGTLATEEKATDMEQNGVSCFNGKSYATMNLEAERLRREGKDVGGAMVVSFGTEEQKKNPFDPFKYEKKEAARVLGDHVAAGEASLNTPQGQKAVLKLAGKEFDRLVAHSNGASVAEALIRKDIITVNELNIVGGDRSLLNSHAYQQLLDSGKVKRVVVWVNLNDPVPGLTSLDQGKLAEKSSDAARHLAQKIAGDPAASNAGVEYRFMWGNDYRNPKKDPGLMDKLEATVAAHYLEESYYPGIANDLGVKYPIPKRVLNQK